MKSCDWLPQTSGRCPGGGAFHRWGKGCSHGEVGRLPSPVPENVPEPVPLKIQKVRTNISNIVNVINVNKC